MFIVFEGVQCHLFQLYRGCQFYWWRKPEDAEKTTTKVYHIMLYTSPWSRFQLPYDHGHDGPNRCILKTQEHQINNYNIIQINVSSFHFIVVILKTCLPDTIAKIYNLHSYICFLKYSKLETLGLFLGRRIWILTLRKTQIISMINSPMNKCRKKVSCFWIIVSLTSLHHREYNLYVWI